MIFRNKSKSNVSKGEEVYVSSNDYSFMYEKIFKVKEVLMFSNRKKKPTLYSVSCSSKDEELITVRVTRDHVWTLKDMEKSRGLLLSSRIGI